MPPEPDVDWKAVVDLIRRADPEGEATLYRSLASGARLFLQRRLGTTDVEDRVHDVFLIVVEAVRRGELRDPERLMGFVRTVLYRQLSQEIRRIIHTRESVADIESAARLTAAEPTPEQSLLARERLSLMKKLLRQMSDRDYEVLSRCYLRGQTPEQVCAEMKLTQVQFQLLKSRAKARLAEMVRRKLRRRFFNPE